MKGAKGKMKILSVDNSFSMGKPGYGR